MKMKELKKKPGIAGQYGKVTHYVSPPCAGVASYQLLMMNLIITPGAVKLQLLKNEGFVYHCGRL